MTAQIAMTRSVPDLRRPGGSVLARLVEALDKARIEAHHRTELRRQLRADGRLRRDIGLSRFDLIRLSTEA